MQEQHPHTNNQSEIVTLTRAEYDSFIQNKREYTVLLENKKELEFQILSLKHELDKLKRMIFGSKSERFVPSDSAQLQLFIEELEQKKIAICQYCLLRRTLVDFLVLLNIVLQVRTSSFASKSVPLNSFTFLTAKINSFFFNCKTWYTEGILFI